MKVLVVSDVSPLVVQGGGERALWEMTSRLAARGHEVRVVSRAENGASGTTVHRGVPVRHFPVDRRGLPAFVRAAMAGARRAVAEEIAAHGADVLHFHQPLAALGALTSAAGRRIPSLYTFHSPAPLEYRVRRGTSGLHRGGLFGHAAAAFLWLVEQAVLARVGRIHVLSDFSASLLWRLYRIRPGKLVKVPGGVDLERFVPEPDRAAVRRKLGLPPERPVLFTLRNLQPRMGLDNLFRAMDLLRARGADPLLLVGGAGSLRPALETLVRDHGLEGHVELLGFVDEAELPLYYTAADAFVLPTRALEGFGLVTVESLACGTPVLGTPVGATPEILAPLGAGLVFDDASPGAMARGLERFLRHLARDPEGAERLRAACRAHAEAGYGWERSVDGLEAVLAGLAAGSRRASSPPAARCVACDGEIRHGLRRDGARYLECRGCGTAVMESPPGARPLRRYYDTDYADRFAPDRVTEPRRRLLAAAVERVGAANGGRLLDVGCGGGHLLREASRRGWRAAGTDVSLRACSAARSAAGAAVVQADASALPFRDGSIAAVTLVNVLDHLTDPRAVVAEARRVLSDGGALLVRVPNGRFHRASARWLARLGPLGRATGLALYPVFHVFSFSAGGLRRLLEREGFAAVEVANSPLIAEGPAATDAPPARLPASVRSAVGAVARLAAVLSGGHWLLAPSIEALARREARR